ncbi:MAG: DUF4377 domain-containing protein [Myxococcales bacterium]
MIRLPLLVVAALLCSTSLAAAADKAPAARSATLFVAAGKVSCQGGEAKQECLQTRASKTAAWTFFYDAIEGFAFEPGNTYELKVQVTDVPKPAQDASSLHYKLEKVVSKEAAPVVVPGTSVGPLKLGMTADAVKATKLPVAAGADKSTLRAGPFEVGLGADGKVEAIWMQLADSAGVSVDGKIVGPMAKLDDVKAAFGPCDANPQQARGGNTFSCRSGALQVIEAGPTQVVTLKVLKPAAQ